MLIKVVQSKFGTPAYDDVMFGNKKVEIDFLPIFIFLNTS